MSSVTGLHHVALTVSDLDRSEAWYRELFGLQVHLREEGEERRAVVLRDERVMIGLVEFSERERDRFDPRVVGLDHAAFTVGERADLDTWERRLDERGIEHSPIADLPPLSILNFKDPDGIALALFWDKPVAASQ